MDASMKDKQVKANLQLDLSNALMSTMSYNGLDVTVTKTGEGTFLVHVAERGIGWSGPNESGQQHAEATVAAGWYDAKGKLLGHVARELTCPRGTGDGGASFSLPVAMTGKPVRLRFVVRDAENAHMGTVDVTKF